MQSLLTYLTEAASEEKLTHLEHAEDHVINDGMEGFAHAYHNLEDVKDQVNGKKNKTKIATKYDGCLHEDTVILLNNGDEKTIKEIITSWSLANPCVAIGVDDNNNIIHTPIVDYLAAITPKSWVRVDGIDGYILLTEDHQVMTDRGWVQAGNLIVGDIIRNMDSYK
jgi:hypothetical protein